MVLKNLCILVLWKKNELVEESGLPVKKHYLTPIHWLQFNMPQVGFILRQWSEMLRSQLLCLRPLVHDGKALQWLKSHDYE